eukprot:666934-Heterocapsa_arctica.AAC.1
MRIEGYPAPFVYPSVETATSTPPHHEAYPRARDRGWEGLPPVPPPHPWENQRGKTADPWENLEAPG